MSAARETEIKLAATPAMLEALRVHPALAGSDKEFRLVTTYFDTIGGRLRRGGASLRIRTQGKRLEQTLKLTAPASPSVRRGEWNIPVGAAEPDPAAFPKKAANALERLLDGGALQPVGTTNIARTIRKLHAGATQIEAAFDWGKVEAGPREQAVCELELELAGGSLADVIEIILTLPLGPELRWSLTSKAERCHALAYDIPPAAVTAPKLTLKPGIDVALGFQTIAWSCLDLLLANYPLVLATGDPDALHQSRVAIRRLRAAFSLFGDAVEDDEAELLRAELREAAQSLGPARDLHVLCARVAEESETDPGGSSELLAELAALRDAATGSAQAVLNTDHFQRLLFRIARWIEAGSWLERHADSGEDRCLTNFAAELLARRRRKLRKAAKRLGTMSGEALHRLRIDVKKLRYATDFFGSLYTGKSARKPRREFGNALAKLQDSLGELNDMAVANARRDAMFDRLDPIVSARLTAQLEGVLTAGHSSRKRLLKAAGRSLDKVAGSPAWWRAD